MKIKKKLKKNSLISFNLIKYQAYKVKKTYSQKFNINSINLEIKQALKIIYLYNIKNKKILFVGFSYNKFLSNQTNHLFISKRMLLNSFNMFNNYDLIVFNKLKNKDEISFKNLSSLNKPLILLGKQDNKFYSINGFFSSKKGKNFFLFLIFSILRKNII